jgi:hypothetical protein
LLQDHFDHFRGVYEDRYEHRAGRWRSVTDEVVGKFLDCGVLEAGFARVRCPNCRAEYVVGFSCKGRYFCPSCHAKRLVSWAAWLESDVLAPVPHRQFVFSLPKRLRPYFLWRRDLLGDLARVAAATTTAFIRAAIGDDDLSVGIVLSIQTHGSLLNWNPHVHALITDGGFLPDGTFVSLPVHDTEVLCEALRRAVLKLFVDRELYEPEVADGMLAWMHSGFSVDDSVWLAEGDAAAHDRLARYCARNPVSLDRMTYNADARTVNYTSDKRVGPTVGTHAFDPLDFIALLVAHIPDKGQVMQRYYGYYSNRQRGARRKTAEASAAAEAGDSGGDDDVTATTAANVSHRQVRLRWAELLRRIYEVDPLTCPSCGAEMRIVSAILEPKVIDKILAHIRDKGRDPRAGPWAAALANAQPAA